MKVNSDNHPGDFTKSKRKIYFNSNIIESKKTDEYGTRMVFDYDQEEVSTDKDSAVSKAMLEKFGTDKAVFKVVEKNRLDYEKMMDSTL